MTAATHHDRRGHASGCGRHLRHRSRGGQRDRGGLRGRVRDKRQRLCGSHHLLRPDNGLAMHNLDLLGLLRGVDDGRACPIRIMHGPAAENGPAHRAGTKFGNCCLDRHTIISRSEAERRGVSARSARVFYQTQRQNIALIASQLTPFRSRWRENLQAHNEAQSLMSLIGTVCGAPPRHAVHHIFRFRSFSSPGDAAPCLAAALWL